MDDMYLSGAIIFTLFIFLMIGLKILGFMLRLLIKGSYKKAKSRAAFNVKKNEYKRKTITGH